GLDAERMRKHADAIREVDADMDGFRLLAGVEVDILKSGKLDLPEDLLAGLDWVLRHSTTGRTLWPWIEAARYEGKS
ncbi:MAG: hypothetical protein R6V12_00755, partial [Candidatus Hydrogenedentota bacterium]